MGLFKMIWSGIVSLATLVVWPVAKLRGMRGTRQVVRWGLHLLFLAATLGLLFYINYAWELDKALRVPVAALRQSWLPMLFMLAYGAAWCVWWLWRLLMSEERPTEFPDIDAAWNEARESLAKAGVDLTQVPLFLIVGRPAETEAAFFSATQLPLTQPQSPRDPNAPLHVHVAEEGVFVTCSGASLLGAQTALLAADRVWKREEPLVCKGRSAKDRSQPTAQEQLALPPIHWDTAPDELPADSKINSERKANTTPGTSAGGTASSATATAAPPAAKKSSTGPQLSQGLSLVEESIALLAEEERPTVEAREAIETMEAFVGESESTAVEVPLVKDLGEIQAIQRRLEHLCRLIATAREPFCPLNGVAVLVPYASAATDRLANQIAALAQLDLEIVQSTMRVQCPLMAIVCDVHEAPGCREMIQLFPEQQRHRRLGVRFPMICNDPAANIAQMTDKGMRWICRELLPALVFRLMLATDATSHASRRLAPTNARLFQFLDEIRQREQRLCRMMRQIFTAGQERQWRPAGCYFVANGTDMAREHGFAAGVLPQLYQMQNLLAWNATALALDQRRRRWACLGYLALTGAVLMLGYALARLI